MTCRISVFLLCLLFSAAAANMASARYRDPLTEHDTHLPVPADEAVAGEVDWPDGTTSSVNFRVTGEGSAMLTKPVDEASPMLRQARESGKHLPRVVVRGRKATWTLENVRISSYRLRHVGWFSGEESVILRYTRIHRYTRKDFEYRENEPRKDW